MTLQSLNWKVSFVCLPNICVSRQNQILVQTEITEMYFRRERESCVLYVCVLTVNTRDTEIDSLPAICHRYNKTRYYWVTKWLRLELCTWLKAVYFYLDDLILFDMSQWDKVVHFRTYLGHVAIPCINSGWVWLNWIETGWVRLSRIESDWVGLSQIESDWVRLSQVKFAWLGLTQF